MDIPTASEITTLTGLLAPGIIILWVRARFRDVNLPKFSDQLTAYAVVSIMYNAFFYPLFHFEDGFELPSWIWQILMNFLVPLIFGVILVFLDKSEWFYHLTEWSGLRPVHHTPTAWDYTFRRRESSYVLIHLADGSQIAGVWTEGSFASSTSGDRDVFLAQMFKVGEGGVWAPIVPTRSILVCGGSIQLIEFIKGG